MPQKVPHMRRKTNTWYVVKKVPKDRVAVVGQKNIELSLKTDSLVEAKRRLPGALMEIQARIDAKPVDPVVRILERAAAERRSILSTPDTRIYDEDIPGGSDSLRDIVTELALEHAYDIERQFGQEVAQRYAAVIHGKGLTLADQIEPWLAAETHITEQTKAQHRKAVAELFAFLGSKAVLTTDVTFYKARDFRDDHLLGKLELTAKTANRYISSLSSLWRWLIDNRHIGDEKTAPRSLNPWLGLGVAKKKAKGSGEKRTVGWSPDELLTILGSRYLGDTLRPLVLLAIYTGARIEELCQLRVQDVHEDDATAIPYLHIRKSKTEAGVRDVPLHPVLRPLVASLVEAARGLTQEGWLLPNLKSGGAGGDKRSHYPSKAFGIMTRDRLGLTDEAKKFHSFRANAITALQRAGINAQTIGQLVGHENGSVTFGVYSDGLLVKQLAEAVEKISYGPKVDALAREMASAPVPPWSTGPKVERRDPTKPKGRPRKPL
jgi:integrase